MDIDNFLSRLEGVKKTGADKWAARCPARDDRHPSMTILLKDDGRILVHDFGGSSPSEILDAVGLTFGDLFPEKLSHHLPKVRRPFSAGDALTALAFEALVLLQYATKMAAGTALSDDDRTRLALSSRRILSAREFTL